MTAGGQAAEPGVDRESAADRRGPPLLMAV